MESQEQPAGFSKYYWAGANIVFAIPFLGIELLSFLNGVSPSDPGLQTQMRSIIILFHLIGGLSGGFLVNLMSSAGWLKGGGVTGVMGYIMEQIVHTVLYGWGSIGDVFTMVALIGGSLAGALISSSPNVRNRLKKYHNRENKGGMITV